ncbi:MAG: hypothetical protein F4X16_12595, partial [Caldilineaceae bacterium SB0661_bin_34]|nr:hypothetical protein [Caldilineaceae bacterium SB0661_bin_34]
MWPRDGASCAAPVPVFHRGPFARWRNPLWPELPFHPQGGIGETVWRPDPVAVVSAPTRTLPGPAGVDARACVQPPGPSVRIPAGVPHRPHALPMPGNRTMKCLSMYHLPVLLCLLVLSGCVVDTALPVGTTPASTISPASTTTSTSLLEPPVRAEVHPAVTASLVPLTVEAVPCPETGPSLSLRCDKEVLLAVRDRLRGEHRDLLRTWHPDNLIENFEGVSLGNDPRRVTGLQLIGWWTDPKFRLVGSLPPALGRLSELTHVVLRENGLRGPIPPEVGQLTRLRVLDLAGNELTGAVPPALGRLVHVEHLDLSGNQLTGPIPSALGQLAQVERLDLSGNQLTGPIPSVLGQLAQVERLDLSGNQLTGSIPGELGQLRNLQELNLNRNGLEGSIPAELGTFWHLRDLDVSHNRLTGLLPAELGQLRQLLKLNVSHNRLTGPLPAELGQPEWLQELRLGHNRLTGPIPPGLDHLLVLDDNRHPVPIASVAEPCPAFGPSPSLRCDKEVLLAVRDRLRDDHLDQLPTWHPRNRIEHFKGVILGDDPRRVIGLEMVGVQCSYSSCGSSGAVPWQLSRLPRLERLVLRENGLLGSIPPALGQLTQLEVLDLAGNELTGSIPAQLGQLAQLTMLDLGHNRLAGPIPAELGQGTPLRELRLGQNRLTGPIPGELGQFTQLTMLDLGHNRLAGPIPAALGQLGQLQELRLHANELTGPIPAELGQLG